MPDLNGFQISLVLLAGVWGALQMILRFFEILNGVRDRILEISDSKKSLNASQKNILFWNDWILLWIGCCIFLALTTGFFHKISDLIPLSDAPNLSDKNVIDTVRDLCDFSEGLAFFGLIANIVGGILDIRQMRKAIGPSTAKRKRRSQSQAFNWLTPALKPVLIRGRNSRPHPSPTTRPRRRP